LLVALTACATDDSIDPATCDTPVTYRIDQVDLPASASAASGTGFDLDGDTVLDNQLGHVAGSLNGMFADIPLDLSSRVDAHLATDTDWRISIATCGDRRLVGLGEPAGSSLVLEGTVTDDIVQVDARQGAFVPVTVLFDGTGDGDARLFAPAEQTRLALREDGDELTGKLGFGIEANLARLLVVHGITRFLDEHLDDWRSGFDTDGNGTLTETEILDSEFAQVILASDIEVGNVGAISLSVDVHATRQ
jgi:hypothetical protein